MNHARASAKKRPRTHERLNHPNALRGVKSALPPRRRNVLVVERQVGVSARLSEVCAGLGAHVHHECSIDRALERFDLETYDVLIMTSVAVNAGDVSASELLEVITAKSPWTQVLFLANPAHLTMAVEAMKSGLLQYARLPIGNEELNLLVRAALERTKEHANKLSVLEPERDGDYALIGDSLPMAELRKQIALAAMADIPVLIVGETGTGKELVAQKIHRQSNRSARSCVAVHLGALPDELVAGELFGYERGAFTGAFEARAGKFEEANGGSIFLDEIGTISEQIQISLLRILEYRQFHRLGGKKELRSDARILAATNESPATLVETGRFRRDLLYRLDVFRILMPPLRDRTGDVALLADVFIKRYNAAFDKRVKAIAHETAALLEKHAWPGNVRELKNVIQRAVLLCQRDTLLPEHLPSRFLSPREPRRATFEIGTTLEDVEKEMIVRTLEVARNRTHAAELLGISRRSLYNKLRRYGID